jgi:peptidoglycan/LPS O-acetylase OafA/YrhL
MLARACNADRARKTDTEEVSLRYRPDIDGLRAVAIAVVVLFHLEVPGFPGGFVGVDVFFVISGFLITSIVAGEVDRGTFSLSRFYERRVRRLFPALAAVLLVTTAGALLLLLPRDLVAFGKSLEAATLFAANIHFYRTANYFDGAAATKPLLHTWSLAVEEQFYVAFPPLLLLLGTRRARRVLPFLALLSFTASALLVGTHDAAVFYLPHFRAWELLVGCVLALGLLPDVRAAWYREVACTVGLGAIAFSVISISRETAFPGLSAAVPVLGAALVIHSGMGGTGVVGRFLESRPAVALGRCSYSLYLWHWPGLVVAKYCLGPDLGPELTALQQLTIGVGSLSLSAISLRFVEQPFRGPRGILTRRTLFACAAGAMGLVVLSGLALSRSRGMPARLPPEVVAVAAVMAEPHSYKGCASRMPPTDARCRLGAAGTPSFLLWGDSQALALAPAVSALASRTGRAGVLAWASACPPLMGVQRNDVSDCREYNDGIERFVEAQGDLRTVVLVGRWALNAVGTRPGAEPGRPVTISEQGAVGNATVFADGLDRTIGALERAGKEIVLVTQVPEIGWSVPSILARSLLFGTPAPAPPTLGEYQARQTVVSKTLTTLLAARHSLRVVDVAPLFCGSGTCVVTWGERPLYRDEHHLSFAGANFVAEELGALF